MSTETLTVKKSVTIPADVAKEAEDYAGERGFSAYITRALRRQLEIDRLGRWVEEAEAKWGPVPDEVREQVYADLAEARARRPQ